MGLELTQKSIYCAESPEPISSGTSEPVCEIPISTNELDAYPLCQIGDNVYADTNWDGGFKPEEDIVINLGGRQLTPQEARQEFKKLNYDPDFAKCFYTSAPAYFSDLELLRMKHGIWPPHFTVITASKGDETANINRFAEEFAGYLEKVTTPEETRKMFIDFRNGMYISDTDCWNRSGYAMGLCFPHHTDGHLGATLGWLFDPTTVEQDAQKRFLAVVYADFGPGDTRIFQDYVKKIAIKYKLAKDHILWIQPPLNSKTIHEGLNSLMQKIPEGEQAEVMIIYWAHGQPQEKNPKEWETILQEKDIIHPTINGIKLEERYFRGLFTQTLTPKKVSSVLLFVNSCHSGMLVD